MPEYLRTASSILDLSEDELSEIATRALDELPYAVIVLSVPDYRIVFANGAGLDVLGTSGIEQPSDALGKRPWDMLQGWTDAYFSAYEHVVSSRAVGRFRDVLHEREGHISYWDIALVPHANSAGEVTAVSTIGLNVTERRQSEYLNAALNDINAAINSTLDADAMMELVVTYAGEALSADIALVNLLENDRWVIRHAKGIPSRFIGQGFASVKRTISELAAVTGELVAVRDARNDDRIDAWIAEKHNLGGALAVPLVVRGQTTGVLIFRYHQTIDTFPEAQKDFLRKVAAALSLGLENARLFQGLAESNRQVTAVLEGITDAFLALDADWRYTYLNCEAERLLGRSRNDLLGKIIWDEFPAAVGGTFYQECHRAMSDRVSVTFEHSSTVGKWFENHAYPSADGITVFFHDITDRKRSEELGEVLDGMHTAINSTRDIGEILRRVMADSVEALGMESAVVALHENGMWILRYLVGVPAELEDQRFPDEGIPVAMMAAQTCDVVMIEDVLKLPLNGLSLVRKLHVRAAISIPLVVNGEVVGVMVFGSRSPRTAFPEAQVDFARKLSASVSLALDNARLFSDAQAELAERGLLLERMNGLVQASQAILGANEPQELVQIVVDAARGLTGARFAASGHGCQDGIFRIGATSVDPSLAPCPSLQAVCKRVGISHTIVDTNTSIRLTDQELRRHERWHAPPNGHVPLRGLLGAPLRDPTGLACGHIMVSDKYAGGEFTAEDEALLNQLAAIASLALQHIDARREAEQRAQEAEEGRRMLDALMEFVPEGITIADAPDVRIRMVSRHGHKLTGRPPETIEGIPMQEHSSKWGLYRPDGSTPADPAELPLSRATQTGEVIANEEWALERPDGSRITVLCNAGPIYDAEGRVAGGVIAWHEITDMKRTQTALENAYQRERQFVEVLQQALAPRKPSVGAGYRTAGKYVPPDSGTEHGVKIGGDFFDVFRTSDGRVGIVIGDVSGKGVGAAALATATRSTVRAFAYETSSAAEALIRANAVLCSQQPWGFFVTVSLAVIDLPCGRITYASAGHPPAAIRRADGRVEFLTIGCPPFGVSEDMLFDEHETNLGPGDKIVFYTDGVSEARHAAVLFGTEGVEDALHRYGHCEPEDLIERLLAAAAECANGHLTDDAAVIVVERADRGGQHAAGGKVQ